MAKKVAAKAKPKGVAKVKVATKGAKKVAVKKEAVKKEATKKVNARAEKVKKAVKAKAPAEARSVGKAVKAQKASAIEPMAESPAKVAVRGSKLALAREVEKVKGKAKKQAGSKPGRRASLPEIDKTNQLAVKWSSLYRKTQEVEPKPYNMRGEYEAKTPIMHKLLGWGYILSNRNDRLEVLFKDGIRYLISNYRG